MRIRRFALLAILVGTLLSACGAAQQAAAPGATAAASASAATTVQAAPTTAATTTTVDHGGMMATAAPTASATGGMDHGAMPTGQSNAPYDAQFIDSMIEHHQGAIAMANQALKEASRPELKALAQNIITAQEAEITQMQDWRKAWYPDLAPTSGMGMAMGDMAVSGDTSVPFDQRFISAMIAHHQGAIAMAKDAEQKAEHNQIKTLAQTIITAQESEITQMQQWQQEWFGQ